MARVKTNTNTGFIINKGDDLREIGEGRANHGAGSRHGFEQWDYSGGSGMSSVEVACYACDSGGSLRSSGRAGAGGKVSDMET